MFIIKFENFLKDISREGLLMKLCSDWLTIKTTREVTSLLSKSRIINPYIGRVEAVALLRITIQQLITNISNTNSSSSSTTISGNSNTCSNINIPSLSTGSSIYIPTNSINNTTITTIGVSGSGKSYISESLLLTIQSVLYELGHSLKIANTIPTEIKVIKDYKNASKNIKFYRKLSSEILSLTACLTSIYDEFSKLTVPDGMLQLSQEIGVFNTPGSPDIGQIWLKWGEYDPDLYAYKNVFLNDYEYLLDDNNNTNNNNSDSDDNDSNADNDEDNNTSTTTTTNNNKGIQESNVSYMPIEINPTEKQPERSRSPNNISNQDRAKGNRSRSTSKTRQSISDSNNNNMDIDIRSIQNKLGPFIISIKYLFDSFCNKKTMTVSFDGVKGKYNFYMTFYILYLL